MSMVNPPSVIQVTLHLQRLRASMVLVDEPTPVRQRGHPALPSRHPPSPIPGSRSDSKMCGGFLFDTSGHVSTSDGTSPSDRAETQTSLVAKTLSDYYGASATAKYLPSHANPIITFRPHLPLHHLGSGARWSIREDAHFHCPTSLGILNALLTHIVYWASLPHMARSHSHKQC